MRSSTRRLSVQHDNAHVDLVLPATVPLETLMPAITDALIATGEFSTGPAAARYGMSNPGGVVLDASKTLSENGIRDGISLTVTRLQADMPAPGFDDVAEAVSAAVTADESPWSRVASRLTGATAASFLAGVTAVLLCRNAFGTAAASRAGCVGVAGTIGVVTLLAAVIAYRIRDAGAGLTLGLMAITFTALACGFAVPGGFSAASAVFATSAAATSAALIRVIACHAALFTTLACCAASCASAAAVWATTAAPLPAVGAGLAGVSLALIEAAPSASITLARLPAERMDDRLRAKAIHARTVLISLIAAFSGSAALGAIAVLSRPSLPHILFATLTGGVLLLRARTRHDIRESAPSIVCGAVTVGAALVAAAVANPPQALAIASLSMLLSVVALYAGFMTSVPPIPSTVRRGTELLQYFALAAVTPLALWMCGLYGALRGLNLP